MEKAKLQQSISSMIKRVPSKVGKSIMQSTNRGQKKIGMPLKWRKK